ncbi:MAG: hypothetical protein Q8O61_01745 [Nocardioides sp.]|nr:hypothetical protein [Nocardioides sp.]
MTHPTRIEYIHASKFGNGAQVAQEFQRLMRDKGDFVEVRHVREAKPRKVPPADLYVFSSPGRLGRPIGSMRRFLKRVDLPAGAKYAILTTEIAPTPDKDGRMPTPEENAKWHRIRPIMTELLEAKHLTKVAETSVEVETMKGPLEEGWHEKVEDFANTLAEVV